MGLYEADDGTVTTWNKLQVNCQDYKQLHGVINGRVDTNSLLSTLQVAASNIDIKAPDSWKATGDITFYFEDEVTIIVDDLDKGILCHPNYSSIAIFLVYKLTKYEE